MCKIVRTQKLIRHNILRSIKSQKASVLHYSIDQSINSIKTWYKSLYLIRFTSSNTNVPCQKFSNIKIGPNKHNHTLINIIFNQKIKLILIKILKSHSPCDMRGAFEDTVRAAFLISIKFKPTEQTPTYIVHLLIESKLISFF